ncbi:MAG: GNAT family N-acetyltransferase [Candidatus Hodarchaeota archaeon]
MPSYLDLGNEILELILDKARNLRLTLLKAYYDERYHFFFQNHGFRVKYLRYLKQKKIEKVSHLNKIEQCGFDLQSIHQDDVKELADFFYPVYYGDIDFQHGIAANTRNEWEEEVQKNLNGQYGRFISSSSFIMRDSITKSVLGSIFVCHWASKTAKITVIGVSKKNQRQGIGSFLIQKSIESLVRKGYQYLQLDVTAGNTPAERLYDKLGFEKIAGEYTADKSL